MLINEICPLCGARATEDHHIIRRSQTPGDLREDWDLNLIGLCTRCHSEIHGGKPVKNEVFWAAKDYSLKELTLLMMIAILPPPKSGKGHLSERNWWVMKKLATFRAVKDSQTVIVMVADLIAELGIKKVPKWIKKA
ncbi:MAG: HNH endonuclease, partial [Chloroflexi bacterium]|nr:HNH endonuclease [Chloroflexota bacterium]